MSSLSQYIDFSQQSLGVSAVLIAFNPIFWNIVARQAIVIFSLGIIRDHLYNAALADQPSIDLLRQVYPAYGLFAIGSILVVSSMWALGVTGTYLGDYFGILMDAPVTGFPFNVTSAPMYWGSTLNFLAVALYHGKPAGLLLTLGVYITYLVACRWEKYVIIVTPPNLSSTLLD
ncbi:Phosphatidyl-N-methylethanolamine N-methyltransferase [Myotisia sp. PD_48]|nr:Phosphatidyl-N-methylethanolamine N-methyltransferase [Myotisia sp. PD_48]